MKEEELVNIVGGANYTSGAFLNSLIRIINTFLELGRNIGSAFNYAKYKKVYKENRKNPEFKGDKSLQLFYKNRIAYKMYVKLKRKIKGN